MPRTVQLGHLSLPSPGFGAMGLSTFYGHQDEEISRQTLRKAIEIGCTVWNTSDAYANGINESLLGSVLKEGDNRSKVFLITKFGNRPGRSCDGSKEWAATAVDASIKRLGSAPDAWICHRMDFTVPIEETVQAMQDVRLAGKCSFIGLSECSATTLRRASAVAKIDFIEIEYSPWTLDHEENGVLAAARELGVVVLAYSPLGRGFLTGRFSSPDDLAEGDTKSSKYLEENFSSTEVDLSDTEVQAIRDVVEANRPMGDRYHKAQMEAMDNRLNDTCGFLRHLA